MAVYKDKWNGYKGQTWRVACYYTDWQGKRRKHDKRGFATKKEAQEYEREYLASRTKDINMSFDAFLDIYMRGREASDETEFIFYQGKYH